MRKDYDEVFAAMSTYPRESQDRLLEALKVADSGEISQEEVEGSAIVWMAVPWSLIQEQPEDAAKWYAYQFSRMVMFGADRGEAGGKVLFTIAGLARDERELWEIPEVRKFCWRVFAHYPPCLFAMIDEDHPSLVVDRPNDEDRLSEIPGRLFFTSVIFGDEVWERQADQSIRYYTEAARALLGVMMAQAAQRRQ